MRRAAAGAEAGFRRRAGGPRAKRAVSDAIDIRYSPLLRPSAVFISGRIFRLRLHDFLQHRIVRQRFKFIRQRGKLRVSPAVFSLERVL